MKKLALIAAMGLFLATASFAGNEVINENNAPVEVKEENPSKSEAKSEKSDKKSCEAKKKSCSRKEKAECAKK